MIAEAASSEAHDFTRDLWKVENARKDAFVEFRLLLQQLTDEEDAAIIIVVDELDRCRPDYALLVLEVIKHFFSVPRVHFILGINSRALQNCVKARYGGDIDAEHYLRKFINVTFSLPKSFGSRHQPTTALEKYGRSLISEMKLPEKISERCLDFVGHVAKQHNISLRDMGKIFSQVALLPLEEIERKMKGWIDIALALLVTSIINPSLHRKLISATASVDEIRSYIGATPELTDEENRGPKENAYNHELTVWFVEILYCCTEEDLSKIQPSLPSWSSEVGKAFDIFGDFLEAKELPSRLQTDWLDLFKA